MALKRSHKPERAKPRSKAEAGREVTEKKKELRAKLTKVLSAELASMHPAN